MLLPFNWRETVGSSKDFPLIRYFPGQLVPCDDPVETSAAIQCANARYQKRKARRQKFLKTRKFQYPRSAR